MVKDVYNHVITCSKCLRVDSKVRKQTQLELFPPVGSLELFSIDIDGQIPRIKTGNQLLVIITDWYSGITRAISIASIASMRVALIFSWLSGTIRHPSGYPSRKWSSNCTYFTVLCMCIRSEKLRTTAFHFKTSMEIESYNKTLLSRLYLYIAEHQRNWNISCSH